MTSSFAGVVHNDHSGAISHLPLQEVRVDALVVDVSARVTVNQIFTNSSRASTSRAKYVFPVPARAAVCAFEMHTSDGQRIIGVAKEKNKASAEHEDALRQGKATALIEWATDDVFTISLGSIPGEETITTVITYVMDLMDDESMQHIRFQIPMCVGQRYGQPPEGLVDASSPSTNTRVRFNVNVQMKGVIKPQDVISPSHPEITVASYQTHLGRPSRHRISAKFRSREFLHRDFVLCIKAADLTNSRCFAELDTRGTVAMQFTLIPSFDILPVATQEYIFLVDRSGSMSGSRIETATKTIALLLRALPSQGTTFNIFSFGDFCDSLWPASLQYSQITLDQATTHVSSMVANYGGTEVQMALDITLRSRDRSRPTVLFVLTDGEAYDHELASSFATVANEVSNSLPDKPLRVFTLGIGETASTAICEGIARAGNGLCLMTTTSEGIVGRCAKLLRAGRTFLLKNITVDWGIAPAEQSASSPSVRFTAMDQIVRQAPSRIDSLYPGVRLVVFAMIKSDTFTVPRNITLRAQRDGTGDFLSFSVPVEQVRFDDENIRSRLIHTLAARRLIMELDDLYHSGELPDDQRVASIVQLGEQYQLVSRYTSFVAIEGVQPDPAPRSTRSAAEPPNHEPIFSDPTWYLQWVLDFTMSAATALAETWFGPPPSSNMFTHTATGMPGGDTSTRPTSPTTSHRDDDGGDGDGGDGGDDEGDETDDTFTTLSSLEGDSWSEWSESRPPSPPPEDPEYVRSPSPDLEPPQRAQAGHAVRDDADATPPTIDNNVLHLVSLQSFDGSFHPNDEFARVVGNNALERGRQFGLDDDLWATVLAIAYFQKHLTGQYELLESLLEKCMDYAYRLQPGLPANMSIPFLLEQAKKIV